MRTDDKRFFTMNQLWQSLVIVAIIGTGFAALTVFSESKEERKDTQALIASTTPAPGTMPAAAVTAAPVDPFSTVRISGQAAIVVDLSNGQTLYSQNADAQLPLASLTKLLTVYEAQKTLSSDTPVTITATALAQDGDYGLMEGEVFAYKDIARLAMVASSNDAAEAIAEAASAAKGVSIPVFMGQAIADAGLSRTSASSATGLDLADLSSATAYGSARDIAKLARQFLATAPDVAKATTKASVTAYSTAGTPHSLANTNPSAASMPGMLMSKTGYTDLAGGNLAIIFDAGMGHPVAIVVLGSTHEARFTDVEKLVRATLASFATH